MNNDYYFLKVHRRMHEVIAIVDSAEAGKNFYTSMKVADSLVKIDGHIDKMEVEARKLTRLSK